MCDGASGEDGRQVVRGLQENTLDQLEWVTKWFEKTETTHIATLQVLSASWSTLYKPAWESKVNKTSQSQTERLVTWGHYYMVSITS